MNSLYNEKGQWPVPIINGPEEKYSRRVLWKQLFSKGKI